MMQGSGTVPGIGPRAAELEMWDDQNTLWSLGCQDSPKLGALQLNHSSLYEGLTATEGTHPGHGSRQKAVGCRAPGSVKPLCPMG